MGVRTAAIWSNSALRMGAVLQISSANITFLGMRERSTMRAASGSNQKLNSAARRGIARRLEIAAHEDNLLDLGFDSGLHAQRQRDIGHRPDGQDGDFARAPLDFRNQELHRRRRDAPCGR